MGGRRKNDSSQLGDSWVVSDDDDENDSSYQEDEPVPVRRWERTPESTPGPARKVSRASSRVAEPEFIMPSIHEDMDGSRLGARLSKSRVDRSKSSPKSVKSQIRSGRTPRTGVASNAHPPSRPVEDTDRVDQLVSVLGHVAQWILDVLGGALMNVKKPISLIVAGYLLVGIFTVGQNLLTNSIYAAISPICRIPGSSLLNLPMCQSPYEGPRIDAGKAHVEFDELMTVQSTFEEVLEESARGVSLPLDMKRSETSIRDLRQVVRHSQLRSRNEMVLEFDGFIETARMASYDLQKFNSHVGRGVDNVLATARWTQRVLDDMALKQSSRGIVPSFIRDTILAPFQPLQFTESRLVDQYIQHTRIVSGEIETLIGEAQALLLVLQNLEDRLDVIHGIALRDNINIQGSKDEALANIWSWLGGNRAQLKKFNNQLQLLRQVGEYRKHAWAHVSGTIIKLQQMGSELEDLRERVGSAELLKDRADIPLAVHIESIRLGVERLEAGREAARQVEHNHVRRVLDSGQEHEMRLVEG